MEKFSDTIEAIKNLQPVKPPDGLVSEVMERVKKDNKINGYENHLSFFGRQTENLASSNVFLGQITSHNQCAFLLFVVGFFYLVAGFVTLWGFQNVMTENINSWLRIQPYITIINGLFLTCAAFLILYRPQVTTFVQYALIVQAILILVNACILNFLITFPFALVSVLIITILAIGFAVLLISAIQSVLKCDTT
jgi:hypothetical protein